MATYAIGDIQGCFDHLLKLLEKVNYSSTQDRLWFAGDLVNRGPKSLETLRFIKSLPNAITVLGNHDLHLLAIDSDPSLKKSNPSIDPILEADDCDEICDWLRQQPLLHHDPSLDYTLVHAGFAPQWDLNTAIGCAREVESVLRGENYHDFFQHMYGDSPSLWSETLTGWDRLRFITNCLTRIRYCDPQGNLDLRNKGALGTQPPGLIPWFKIPNRKSKNVQIIFGHWASLNGRTDEPNVFAIDTGCAWGNSLTALRLEDKHTFSVKA